MGNSRKLSLLLIILIAVYAGCAPLKVDHDVTGSVTVTVAPSPELLVPFFLTDCATRTSGQPCYEGGDPTACAKCMARNLYNFLTLGTQSH